MRLGPVRLEVSANAQIARPCKPPPTHILTPPYLGALWEVASDNLEGWVALFQVQDVAMFLYRMKWNRVCCMAVV